MRLTSVVLSGIGCDGDDPVGVGSLMGGSGGGLVGAVQSSESCDRVQVSGFESSVVDFPCRNG